MLNPNNITFRPVEQRDLALLRSWMREPHWQKWWGDKETEIGYIEDMLVGRDTTRPFIFQVDMRDIGYIQYWTVKDNLFEPWLSDSPWMKLLPKHAIGVDLSIGAAEYLEMGIGSRALALFAEQLKADGQETIIIDPSAANHRAIKAYQKAGFREIEALRGKTGDTHLMQFDTNSAIDRKLRTEN